MEQEPPRKRLKAAAVAVLCRRFAAQTPSWVGSPWTFLAALALTVGWIATGPLFDFSNAWLLVPATVTSTVTFLVVFLIQYSQNRDIRALQLKLDELIRSLSDARTHLVRLERMSDEELEEIESEFQRLRERGVADG